MLHAKAASVSLSLRRHDPQLGQVLTPHCGPPHGTIPPKPDKFGATLRRHAILPIAWPAHRWFPSLPPTAHLCRQQIDEVLPSRGFPRAVHPHDLEL